MGKDRKNQILSAVIEHFIKTAQPVGSKTIILTYDFKVSPATIRNDMAALEKEGLIMQPHTSAGRIPTNEGYRLYVDELANFNDAKNLAHQTLNGIRTQEKVDHAKQRINAAVRLLSQASPNLAFATIPENDRTFFMGFSKMLKQPEFLESPMQASQVMEVIENGHHFLNGLKKLNINAKPSILIGETDILNGIDSCSLIVLEYHYQGYKGYMGVLGPKRMPYAFNTAILQEVQQLLESGDL